MMLGPEWPRFLGVLFLEEPAFADAEFKRARWRDISADIIVADEWTTYFLLKQNPFSTCFHNPSLKELNGS
jgi:hypothetical protein